MTGDKTYRLRVIAVSQRNTCIGGTTGRSGDARHHLEGNAFGSQFLDLFPAPTEDERIPPFQAQHALALLRQVHQLAIDLLLRQGMLATALANIDALGIAPAHIDDRRRNQSIVEHHIGLLHQAQGTEGQQVGIAGAGADQVHLAQLALGAAGQLVSQQALGLRLAACQHLLGDRPLEYLLPEHPALLHIGEALFHRTAELLRQPGKTAIGGGDQRLQASTHQPGKHRGVAAAGHRHHQRRAIDNGREDHTA
ncbi:hypothetical protein D3C84_267210 [compost metagenome]